jgi:hypothetical protein
VSSASALLHRRLYGASYTFQHCGASKGVDDVAKNQVSSAVSAAFSHGGQDKWSFSVLEGWR